MERDSMPENRHLHSFPSDPADPRSSASSDSKTTTSALIPTLVNPRDNEFRSQIFTILVGPSKEAFTAHCDTLSRSKVLKAQCSGGFYEEHSKVIQLKDSDPKIFAPLLEYLYRGDYWPKKGNEFITARSEDMDVRATQMRREADLYCMADCYDIPDLQKLSVEKMQKLTPLRVESFLDISEQIYDQGGSGGRFRAYFREQIGYISKDAVRPWIEGKETISGELATDLFLSRMPEDSSKIKDVVEWPYGWKAPSKKDKKEPHVKMSWGFGQQTPQPIPKIGPSTEVFASPFEPSREQERGYADEVDTW